MNPIGGYSAYVSNITETENEISIYVLLFYMTTMKEIQKVWMIMMKILYIIRPLGETEAREKRLKIVTFGHACVLSQRKILRRSLLGVVGIGGVYLLESLSLFILK